MPHLSQIARRKIFWLLDTLQGGTTKRHYKEIKEIHSYPQDVSIQHRRKLNLDKLLAHATKTTSFYGELGNLANLEDFPIIDKNTILNHYDDFKSDQFEVSKLYKASSSGSTGIPFSIYQNNSKRTRNTADVIYFTQQAGGAIGNKLFYIKLWDHTNAKSKWETFVQNIFAHNVMDTSRKELKSLVSRIQKHKSPKTILGYPSFFEELCDYLDGQEQPLSVKNVDCVISMAEALKKHERKRMSDYFKAPVFERYSNQENGILAQQTQGSNGKYLLNWASYHFEILELHSDKHVESGGLGRIVVTDLFNYSMPMIRYDTGDMAIYEESKDGLPYLSKIYGRRMDSIYNTSGEIVSPFIFYMVLDFSKIRQFQFIQTKKTEYLFKLNGNPKDVPEEEIVNYFRTYLGEDAKIRFSYVEEIPLLSSGKRKKIVNHFHKEPATS
ncbi:CoF synthetase [Flagellimonas myxillae]|uniref:CoF synthetase n=1 Tax=Flagellimonas myxillae TaxID=2942214 RepID=UPI00201F3872|nr:CoF synthetase [Muricauda myxillae]MCL6266212.1 CoF synthetase [Muricauda myxillae]